MTHATTLAILTVMIAMTPAAVATTAQTAAPVAAELTALLNEFLAGASRNDAAIHDRFWADDLVYTRAAGQRLGKAEILRDVATAAAAHSAMATGAPARSAAAPKAGEPATAYAAEDVRIQTYGDTAVVAFRLVGTTGAGTAAQVDNYLNTGTFVRRGGRWQAVAWQATKVPAEAAAPARGREAGPAGSGRLLPPGRSVKTALTSVVLVVMIEHVWFLVLEMFLWTRPLGLKTFRNTPEFARQSAALAANQGLYNGFLAAGLLWGMCHPAPEVASQITIFFLACVALAASWARSRCRGASSSSRPCPRWSASPSPCCRVDRRSRQSPSMTLPRPPRWSRMPPSSLRPPRRCGAAL